MCAVRCLPNFMSGKRKEGGEGGGGGDLIDGNATPSQGKGTSTPASKSTIPGFSTFGETMRGLGMGCLPGFMGGKPKGGVVDSITINDGPSKGTATGGSSATPSGFFANGGDIIAGPGLRHFTVKEMKAASNNFNINNLLGVGGYGQVFKAKLAKGVFAAVKRRDKQSFQGETEFRTEIELLSSISHPNVVRLLGYCNERDEQMLVYEYISKGTLRQHLSKKAERPLTWKERLDIAIGTALGIAFLHSCSNPIIHRDIKAANILLTDALEAKVADLGLGKLTPDGATHISTVVKGTMGYMDPDYYVSGQLTEKSDVYSYGVVLLETFTGRSPICRGGRHIAMEMDMARKQKRWENLIDASIRGQYNKDAMEHVINIALLCCNDSPKHRPSMEEVSHDLQCIADPQLYTSAVADLAKVSSTDDNSKPVIDEIHDQDGESSDSVASMNEYNDATIITTHVEDWTVVAPR